MPELPEVETMVRGLQRVVRRRIRRFAAAPCAYKPLSIEPEIDLISAAADGCCITAIRRRAKRVVIELETEQLMVIEPRMTGLMLLADPPDVEHLRLCWEFSGRSHPNKMWFWDRRGLGTLRLLSPEDFAARFDPPALGPDALEMTEAIWRAALARTSRPIKPALLDQKLVAGIGNLYASEMLHLAKIHPETPANSLSKQRIARLAKASSQILLSAIEHEGSTLGDGTYRNALNSSGSYQNLHRVYDRTGEKCEACGSGRIRRIVQSQRSTFYCPRCQRR